MSSKYMYTFHQVTMMKSENITWINLKDTSVGDLPLLGSRVGLIKWDELYTQLRGASLC